MAENTEPAPAPDEAEASADVKDEATKAPPSSGRSRKRKDRTEEFDQVRPSDGATVTVQRNIETGESKIVKTVKSDG